jgi:glycosyltransferase involved in cell wall biosynthesis
MKILILNRLDAKIHPAGDTAFINNLAMQLKKLKVDVDISSELKPNIKKYDLIHLVNISRPFETFIQFNHIKKSKKRIVFMPIYQDFTKWSKNGTFGIIGKLFQLIPSQNAIEFLKNTGRCILDKKVLSTLPIQFLYSYTYLQNYLLQNSDGLLFSTNLEKKYIEKKFNIKMKMHTLIPSGFDKSFSKATSDAFIKKYKTKNFVLCVANFHSRKNQLNLLKALRNSPFKIVLVGQKIKTHSKYFSLIQKEIETNKNAIIIPNLSAELLKSAYAAAKVHVLPSWTENSPLVTLEAAAGGCNIVTTINSFGNEFLGSDVWYCDPGNIESINTAVEKAYKARKTKRLKNYVLKHFTWEIIAKKTLNFYNQTLQV